MSNKSLSGALGRSSYLLNNEVTVDFTSCSFKSLSRGDLSCGLELRILWLAPRRGRVPVPGLARPEARIQVQCSRPGAGPPRSPDSGYSSWMSRPNSLDKAYYILLFRSSFLLCCYQVSLFPAAAWLSCAIPSILISASKSIWALLLLILR